MENNPENITRREFIDRAIKAGISVSLVGGASFLLHDSRGPKPLGLEKAYTFPAFDKPKVKGRSMSVVRGRNRKKSLRRALDLLGGISRFVKPGNRVMIKPNIAFASSPDLGATTHPDIISLLTRLSYKAGAKKVFVMDNPINDPASCFLLSGIERAARQNGAEIIYPRKNLMKPVTLPGGRLIQSWPTLFSPFEKIDCLIGASPLKNHHRSGASMTMKNWYGLLGGRRNIFHQDINTIISELALLVKPSLVILDGIDIMATNGPTGGSLSDLIRGDTLIASVDQVAADSFGSSLLGLKIRDLPFLLMAEKQGAGTTDYKSLKPVFTRES